MSLCKDCVSGVRHEGTPEGKFETINGVDTYIATPTADYPKDKVLLFFPDVFGMQLVNSQLLADDYARNGFKTILIDYFKKDSIPADALNPGGNFDFMAWLGKHDIDDVVSLIRDVMSALKEEGVTKFGVAGYCYGARPAFNLAFMNEIHVLAISHPSLLQIPADLQKYLAESKAPLLINSCETDEMFPIAAQEQADAILGDGKFTPGYERSYWPGASHGFAVRGDLSDPRVKAAKEGAFKANVEFLIKHL